MGLIARLLPITLIPLVAACSGVAQVIVPPRPTPLPTVTPHPRDIAPPGARLTPYAIQRLVLDTLPFPANTLAIPSLTTIYNGDGTWTARATITERLHIVATPPPGGSRDLAPANDRVEIVTTPFEWTVSDADRSVTLTNEEGRRWMTKNWHPGP